MRQEEEMGSVLAQIIACRLFGDKPLSKPMLGQCQLDSHETNFSDILIQVHSSLIIHLNTSCVKWRPFVQGVGVGWAWGGLG